MEATSNSVTVKEPPPGFKHPYVLNSYRDMTREMCRFKGWDRASIEQVWLFFIEEVGELASAIRRGKRQYCDNKRVKIEDEMGDVFSYLFQIAAMANIDLDAMWHRNQIKAYNKTYLTTI